MSPCRHFLLRFAPATLLLGLLGVSSLGAWDADEAPVWPNGTVTLHLQLGSSPIYGDGTHPNSTALEALKLWNPHLGRVQLKGQSGSNATKARSNNVNNVFFARDYYGTAFGSGVLAVTLIEYSSTRLETDVVVNSAESWDSYRGGLQSEKIDLRRVLIHEFGHVLGLDHPDNAGQWVDAVMNSHIGAADAPTRDDSIGAGTLYGSGTANPVTLPEISSWSPDDATRTVGESVFFSVNVTSEWPVTYQWRKDAIALPEATNSSFEIEAVELTDAGVYDVLVSNAAGTVKSRGAQLTVNPAVPPEVRIYTQQQSVRIGDSFRISASVDGTGPLTYQWYKDGIAIEGAETSWISISNATAASGGQYTITVTNPAGSVTSPAVVITIVPVPAPAVAELWNQRVELGESFTWSVHSYNEHITGYTWYKDGKIVADGSGTSSYFIAEVTADHAGEYLVVLRNRSGTTTSRSAILTVVPTSDVGLGAWSDVQQHGSIVYFLFENPARIERYDLATQAFLSPVSLPRSPSAFTIYDDALFVAFGRSVSRFPLSGGAETPLFNSDTPVEEFAAWKRILFVRSGSGYADLHAYHLDQKTLTRVASDSYYWGAGLSVAPSLGKLFGVSTGISPSDISQATLNADGTFASSGDSSYHGNYATGSETYVSPNEHYVISNAGIVYSAADLTFQTALGPILDVTFASDGSFYVLRGYEVTAYQANLTESGRYQLRAPGHRLGLRGDTLAVFTPPQGAGGTIQVQEVARSDFTTTRPPAPAVDPANVPFTPDQVVLDRDGNLLLLSRLHRNVFHWSVSANRYLPSIPLQGAANFLAYSSDRHTLYLGYADNRVTALPLGGARTERDFVAASDQILGLAVAGDYVFLCDPAGAWESFYTYDASGRRIAQREWSYPSAEYIWSPDTRRLYHFRDGTSPNDLLYTEINADGTFGDVSESPYHGDFTSRYPIRVSPNGSAVLLGTGRFFNGETLAQNNTLANDIDDAAWLGQTVYTARATLDGVELQRWGGNNYLLDRTATRAGRPLRLFAIGTNRLLLVTSESNRITYSVYDQNLNLVRTAGGYQGPTSWLLNLSTRAHVARDGDILIAGFVVNGSAASRILLRAVGPALGGHGVSRHLSDPVLHIYDTQNNLVASNDDWGTLNDNNVLGDAFASSGAFGFSPGSRDAALVATLDPGSYTAHVSGLAGLEGVGLVELYQLGAHETPTRLVNISSRAKVGTDADVMISGIVVDGSGPRRVLIRAVGPGLAQYDVPGTLRDPVLKLFRGDTVIAENNNWSASSDQAAELAAVMEQAGAFPLVIGSRDAALITTLDPGNYTVQVSGANRTTGVALVEVYQLPD